MTAQPAAVAGPEPDLIARREGAAGIIRLNRPKAINAVTLEMFRDIETALDAFEADPEIGLILLEGAGGSDLYVVMVRTGADGPGGISTLVIEGDTPGLSFGANERKMGWNAQPTRAVIFENARVPVANRLGDEGIGFKIAMAGLDGGRINIAACSLGGAQCALDKSLVYMKERKAFGKRLDEFQALQFRLADMATELEAARTFVWRAAAALDRKDADATMLCAMAKRFGTDVGFEVANQALQLHGGYGYLSEYGIEKIVRDLRVHQILEGTNEIMRLIVARKLIEGAR